MQRLILAIALTAPALPATAADVYCCIAPDGTATYRDSACPIGFVHSRTYRAVDEADVANQAQRDAQYVAMGRSWLAMEDAASTPATPVASTMTIMIRYWNQRLMSSPPLAANPLSMISRKPLGMASVAAAATSMEMAAAMILPG